ncbi:MAG: DUF4392 domain-containing protein [Planctomycetaceae bacterium]|nr:DUF4392 domain-containing protein [Planctomycetaceae bacterium]
MTDTLSLLNEFDGLIRHDPAMRGLISSERHFGPVCPGHFAGAAQSLAGHDLTVAIVTGFYVPKAEPPAAETDGPPGALRLALALEAIGYQVVLITDAWCKNALRVAAEGMGFPPEQVLAFPQTEEDVWIEWFFTEGIGSNLTHLIAIERVGPTHTQESFTRQTPDPESQEIFLQHVAPESWGRCHNMRGEIIDEWTGGLHRLFEFAADSRPEIRTIGIGDGGNEIGMGCLSFREISQRLAGHRIAHLPCRIATNWNIVAGISNWGAYALAAGVLSLRERVDVMEPWTCTREEDALKHLVQHGPAVDGATRLHEATVDGLPFITYIQTWAAIRRRLGLPE